jgi:hypothetical protein
MKMSNPRKSIKVHYYAFIILWTGLLLACTSPSTTTAPSIQSDGQESVGNQSAYPEPNNILEDAYPSIDVVPTLSPPSAYPPPTIEEEFEEPRFRLDLPLVANGTTVTGQALPNMPVAIVDITFNGVVLGSGVSDDNGRFNINVKPLPQGHRIGITFSELQPGKSFNDMSIEYFPHRGEGFMNLPNVGIFFDTALVE